MINNSLIILSGPTAVGKTDLSIQLAKTINGEIISADSMQVYRGMNIGTAKIKAHEMQGIRHYLIDEYNPDQAFNVFEFQKKTKEYINIIYKNNKVPIIVGGTGFYIQSVLYDIDFSIEVEEKQYREKLEKLAKDKGNAFLHNMLQEVDPDAANEIHPNNVKKVIRALDFYYQTGNLISAHNKEQRQNQSPYNYAYFVLNRDRNELYDRINKRVDLMIESGLIDEVKGLLNQGYNEKYISMQGLGYKEIILYLKGLIPLEEAIDQLKTNTRHFAKRQITWFNREKDINWLNYEDYASTEDMLKFVINILKEKQIV